MQIWCNGHHNGLLIRPAQMRCEGSSPSICVCISQKNYMGGTNLQELIDTLQNIDCIIGMQAIPDKSIDMICTDLPYGITRNGWDKPIPFDQLWGGH